jgi:hypothetical protein
MMIERACNHLCITWPRAGAGEIYTTQAKGTLNEHLVDVFWLLFVCNELSSEFWALVHPIKFHYFRFRGELLITIFWICLEAALQRPRAVYNNVPRRRIIVGPGYGELLI